MDALAGLIYTMMFLVIFIGAINIINTRYTNIILRKKEFGTLLAIGIQKGDLRKIIILVIGVFILLVINLLSSFIPYIKLKKLEINELIRNEE